VCSSDLICEAIGGEFKDYEISPDDFGFKKASEKDLLGGDINENVRIALDILNGGKGPKRDIVLLNSGCAIYAADKAGSIAEGIKLAEDSIDSGKALKKLNMLKEYS
jgi:anthranilate phosphoribosyltransferase